MRRSVFGAVFLAAAGCFVITGSTDGYQRGTDASAGGCAGSSDCDAGQVCCAALPTALCQTGPCALAQLCRTTMECGDAAPGCAVQSCKLDGSTFTLQACGALSLCSFK